jgi:hypothetical protein
VIQNAATRNPPLSLPVEYLVHSEEEEEEEE